MKVGNQNKFLKDQLIGSTDAGGRRKLRKHREIRGLTVDSVSVLLALLP